MQRHPREGWKAARQVMEARTGRPVTRRDFLRTSAGAGIALPSLAAIMAACTNPRNDSPDNPSNSAAQLGKAAPNNPQTLPIVGEPIADGMPSEKGATLQIFNWDAYMWKKIIEEFCAEEGCDYEWTTFNNMEEAVTKIQSGQFKFDVFFPTYDVLGKMVLGEFLRPLNKSYIPNLANVWDEMQSPFYDVGSQYSVPYVVYSTGISYRRDAIPDDLIHNADNPRAMLWDPQYNGRVGVYDSERDTIAFALQKLGINDINTESDADLQQASDALQELTDAVNARVSINGSYAKLPKGDFDLHESWSGDIVAGWGYVSDYTEAEFEKLGYWYDGTGPVDNDTVTVGATGDNPVLAHKFLNFFLDYQHSMDNFSWNGYQPPQTQADISALTSTEGRYSAEAHWAPPITYVPKWMPDAVVQREWFGEGAVRLLELTPEGDDKWNTVWEAFKAG
jgi:spermidine/putrescine transport system substrate-binding protein